jgi:hypothetical protein
MRRAQLSGGRAGFGAATFAALALVGCATDASPAMTGLTTASPHSAATAAIPSSTPTPSSPRTFALERIDRSFPSVIALTSTGAQLYWASEASVWRFAPGDDAAQEVYEDPDEGAVVWDVAAVDGAYVFSERLAKPLGLWRVQYIAGNAPAVELDRGIAERGAPPTPAIDERRIAWAGFDESTGTPRSFLRTVERARRAAPTTLLDLDIDAGLLWYPQLDRDALWYSIIEPDFEGTGAGDEFHIATIDLANPSGEPDQFMHLDRVFEPAVSTDYVVWKAVDPELAALTWGDLHALDRRSNERLVIAEQANHPSVGSRFVAFEEITHSELLLYDLATRALVEVPDPVPGANGTVGVPAVSGNLLGYSVSVKGSNTVYWNVLPG